MSLQKTRIISWNVNGIRACATKGLVDFIQELEPDILCLQETKAHREQVDPSLQSLGYDFDCWSSAVKKGYSGVATFSVHHPVSAERGIQMPAYDSEGRFVVTDHGDFLLFNVYFPNGGSGPERHGFKQKFLKDFTAHLQALKDQGRSLIVVGDYNVAHQEYDVFDPVRLSKESGFLPEERQWFSEFLSLGFVDTFRRTHPQAHQRYSWWSYREGARPGNRGWRIDYICVTEDLFPRVKNAEILDHVHGSDHCPVLIDLF